jgi:hypothetical protein
MLIRCFIAFAISAVSFGALAKEIIRDEPARVLYNELLAEQTADPEAVKSNTNAFFGDLERPHLGRLWLTSIYRADDWSLVCYQYDFRDTKVLEYLCERR